MTKSYTAVKPIKDIFEYFVSIRQEKYFHKREVLNISDRFYAYWLPLIYISPQRNRPLHKCHMGTCLGFIGKYNCFWFYIDHI